MTPRKSAKALPEPWRVHHGRDPEAELLRLKRRFEAISRPLERGTVRRRMARLAGATALIAVGAMVLYFAFTQFSPWSAMLMLRHIASSPNCDAARAVGLAPAIRGQPGYWPSHDADQDGKACEPWRHRRFSPL
jgi:Excalibur calcium-binding domain